MASPITSTDVTRLASASNPATADRLSADPLSADPLSANGVARAQFRTLTGVQVLSTGSYVPDRVVTNHDLGELGYDEDWIVQRTGIHQRRHAPPEMATSDMALRAALQCLEAAECHPSDVDLVLVATMTPDQPIPSTACLVQERLGISAGAVDLNAACAGFMYALVTGMQFVKAGSAQRVLVIGADTNSRIVDPADKKTYPLFGDGAGAVLLGPGSSKQGAMAYTLGADGGGAQLLKLPGGGSRSPLCASSLLAGEQYIKMDGRSVFKWAVRLLADTVRDGVQHAGLAVSDIDLFVLHQANIRIIDAAREALDVPRERLVVNLDRYGNTSGGSIPLALDEAYRSGRIQPGSRVLLCGFGAGLAWGTALLQW